MRRPLTIRSGPTGRALEERLLLSAPELFRWTFGPVLRMPARAPLRRVMLRRALRQALEALNRRDLDAVIARYDPEVVFYLEEGPASFPDLEPVYRGQEGARQVMRRFMEVWEDVRWEPRELLDAGDRFVVLLHVVGRGRDGMNLREELGVIYTVSGGRVVGQSQYWGWDRTVELAGLT